MFSIIICTYNRADTLKICLDSILEYGIMGMSEAEVIVVDNNSTDHTADIVKPYLNAPTFNCKYIFENNQGLSHARNRGARESANEWLFYLDDDAQLMTSTIPALNKILQNPEFEFFGGLYQACWWDTKPKWLPETFGTKTLEWNKNGFPKISGGVMVIKKYMLEEIGYFNTGLGMKGNALGYSEETDLQYLYEHRGKMSHVYPNFQVLHLVSPKKYKVSWHIKNSFIQGRDDVHGTKINYFKEFFYLAPLGVIVNSFKLLTLADFYLQNLLIDSMHAPLFAIGKLYQKFKSSRDEI